MIKAEKINKRYFGYEDVIKDVSLEIGDGEKFVLYGPYKSGKTTILKMLAGLEKCDSGVIYQDGKDIKTFPLKERGAVMIFEDLAIPRYKTVKSILKRPFRLHGMGGAEAGRAAENAAMQYGIYGLLDIPGILLKPYDAVRVAVSRGFMRAAGLTLIDNPLKRLPASERKEYFLTLLEYAANSSKTVIYATDEAEELKYFGGRIALINYGVIKQIGTYKELSDNPVCLFTLKTLKPDINVFQGILRVTKDCAFAEISGIRHELTDIDSAALSNIKDCTEALFAVMPDCVTLKDKGINAQAVTVRGDGLAGVRISASEGLVWCGGGGSGIAINLSKAYIFDALSEQRIL